MRTGILLAFLVAMTSGVPESREAGEEKHPSPSWPSLKYEKVAEGLANPTAITHAGDGSGRLFVLEQPGRIRIVKEGSLTEIPFLDISDRIVSGGERGLLGLAFSPRYPEKNHFYVNYTRAPDGATVVSRFRVSEDSNRALPGSEEVLLTVSQPYSNHNGGQIAFGPDGYLYIGMGDGGAGGDPKGHGQNPGTLLGALLRIDVEGEAVPYGIPRDNPFLGNPQGRDEIWAIGLRNPWRFSFDRKTGDLYIADVGQRKWEEIDFQPASSTGGENYGWNILEGDACFEPPRDCESPPRYVAPVAVYGHDQGCSVTGGTVYRGPGEVLQGIYVYGDYCTGRIWGLRRIGDAWESQVLAETSWSISTFGDDEGGHLYAADHARGIVYRVDEE